MITTNSYDNLNRLTSTVSTPVSYTYQYNDSNQRIQVTQSDGSYWVYQYDQLGQVTSGKKYWSDNSAVAGQQFEYGFDDIGNHKTTKAGGDSAGANLRPASYSANALNQYTARTVPGFVDILGNAHSNATVTVNLQPTSRKAMFFRKELALNNSVAPAYQTITNVAVLVNSTNNIVVTNFGSAFLPQTPEAYTYDADGNLLSDGRWTYTWDAENRLIQMVGLNTLQDAAKRKLTFAYDFQARRINKKVYSWNSGSWILDSDTRFLYDSWNLIAELDGSNQPVRSYQWGLDLSGSLQEAGGVGGLLAVNVINNGVHFAAYDGNGNLSALVKAGDGITSASYEYGPFGELLKTTGAMTKANPFRFSTKYQDDESGLLYYGYRFYNPSTGRWPNRDPLGEIGGLNLYGLVGNDPVQRFDPFGLDSGSYGYPHWPPPIPPSMPYYPPTPPLPPPPINPPGLLGTGSCKDCPNANKAAAAINKILSGGGKCAKWFTDHGARGELLVLRCRTRCNPLSWPLTTWTWPFADEVNISNRHCNDPVAGIASLFIHELAHHYCGILFGREKCAEDAQTACANEIGNFNF